MSSQTSLTDWEVKYETKVELVKLPPRIKACVVRHDCYNTILINEDLAQSDRLLAYKHELAHIRRGDFHADRSASEIEEEVHREN